MAFLFDKNEIIKSALSPYENYCIGYSEGKCYITAFVAGTGVFKRTFSHPGSSVLDKIVAYDQAEISEAYLGQINMITVSSFSGPQGLIWGYDLAKKDDIPLPHFLPNFDLRQFKGIEIKSGENLRKASLALFGTKDEKHFPFLPGSHVPCAGRFYFKTGPTNLYGSIAIGIPQDRNKNACLLMEDVGEITFSEGIIQPIKERLMFNAIRSVIEVGKNHNIKYREIFVDFVSQKVESDEIGCVLVTMPYFLIAQKAVIPNLAQQTLHEWLKKIKNNFLCNLLP